MTRLLKNSARFTLPRGLTLFLRAFRIIPVGGLALGSSLLSLALLSGCGSQAETGAPATPELRQNLEDSLKASDAAAKEQSKAR
ncbi:MAG: hypothetical protein IRY99_10295 [Isosphaeraceae bacterium]|nr:hypothetical protein [Isosphaeraceae bacterium]